MPVKHLVTVLFAGMLFQQPAPPPQQPAPTAEQRLQLDLNLCSGAVGDLKEVVLQLQLEVKRLATENAELKKKAEPAKPEEPAKK